MHYSPADQLFNKSLYVLFSFFIKQISQSVSPMNEQEIKTFHIVFSVLDLESCLMLSTRK